ncbi:carboxypeptidase [Thozetella sp. PMI_491]|nr:carboxypeptidase [Thozetella sp. PMI_491]
MFLPLAVVAYLFVPHFASRSTQLAPWLSHHGTPSEKALCVQPDPLFPSQDDALDKAYDFISSETFRSASIKRLSGAVQIKSESFDDLGPVGEDPRWEVFFNFYTYLQATFPLIHEKLKVEKVNTHGLFYTWEGSDSSLKPTLLMAHQDTVPVPPETVDAWTHPPWSGHYDGKKIWGRGASDCKNQLIGVMETIELLLETKFQPKRTILLSFGFDEECSGFQGALPLADFIHKRYGDDSLAIIVDEGSGFQESWGTLFAKPGTGEKGYLDVHVVVRMPGGHSSVPVDHTGIGVLSELITKIESSQYPTFLEEENPYYSQLQCGAAYAPDFPSKLKKLLAHRWTSSRHTCKSKQDPLALEAAKQGPEIKYLMQTSQAVDVISGGIKVNALPERVQTTVNHRINVGDTSKVVYDRLTALAGEVAKKYNLTLHAFDGIEEASSIMLVDSRKLEVAPVTPTDGSVLSPFSVLAGTVRALYGTEVIVAPGISTGNTDTKYYWDLTKHIFRFGPGHDPEDSGALSGVHTVDENVNVANHLNVVRWFTMFLRNMDEVDLD